MEFKSAKMPVKIAAEALKVDPQTVRVLIQQKLVPWGIAFKMPGSNRFQYLISPKSFYESTGFLWGAGEDC